MGFGGAVGFGSGVSGRHRVQGARESGSERGGRGRPNRLAEGGPAQEQRRTQRGM